MECQFYLSRIGYFGGIIILIILSFNLTESRVFSESNQSELSCNCVAFRLDDIQDYWLDDVQIEIMSKFEEKSIPLTIGIIGNQIGEDQKILNILKKIRFDVNNFEVANHGWKHEDFSIISLEQQSVLIKLTNDKVFDIIGTVPTVFIPPFNQFNENTLIAIKQNGITHLSSSIIKGDFPPFLLKDSEMYRFPETATTGKFNNEINLFVGENPDITFSNIESSLEKYGFAVITMHPQEFSIIKNETYVNQINQKQIENLELLISKIKDSKLKIVQIGQINLDSDLNFIIPSWIKNNAGWWADGQIDDTTFVQGIQYMITKGIIVI